MIVNRPTISVIVPVYNAEKVLCRCVTSILHQSYSDFEILLINDGSSDSSGGICEQFSVEDCRVRVFHQVNGGVSSARNKGLSEARGEYLCFIDSDDWVDSDFFSLIIKSLRSHDMVFFGGRVEKLSGEQLGIMSPLSMQTSEDAFSDIVFSLFKNGILGYMCFMAIKLDLVRNNRIRFREDISIHEDSIFCYQCLFKASRIASLDIQPYHYVSYTGEKITLSSRIPDNYCYIVIERIKEMERLAVIKEIPFDKKEYILNHMKYWAWGKCLDWASVQPDPVLSIRFVIQKLSVIRDFSFPSLKGFWLSKLIHVGNPYVLLFCKRMIKRLNVK